jgi:hypothetical protein
MAVFTSAALISAAVAGGFAAAAGGVTILGTLYTGWAAFGIVAAGSLLASAATTALTPKPKAPSLDFSGINAGQTIQVLEPVTPRRVIYGEVRVSGPVTFGSTTGSGNTYLHMILPIAGHEVAEIGTVYLNDTPIHPSQIDGSGNVTSGPYANRVRIKKHLGGAGQVADADLIAECSDLDANFVGNGVAYVYVRYQSDTNVFPNGRPNLSAQVKGKKVYDPRDGGTRWAPNPALCWRDYLTNTYYGRSASASEVDDTFVVAAANACDEMVTVKSLAMTATAASASADTVTFADAEVLLFETGDRVRIASTGSVPGGLATSTDYFVIVAAYQGDPAIRFATSYANALAGTGIDLTDAGSGTITVTKNAEPRYTCNGTFDMSQAPADILRNIHTSMGARAPYTGGKWRLYPAVWMAPTVEYGVDDLTGPVTVQTRHARRDRFNALKGTYIASMNLGQPTDYPPVTNSTWQAQDGGERVFNQLDLPFTNRPQTAQRLAKIELERHRRQMTVEISTNFTGMLVQAGDNLGLTFPQYGWSNKSFELVEWKMGINEGPNKAPLIGFSMSLREVDAACFSFDETTEEVQPAPAPATNLPSPFFMDPPESLTLESGTPALFRKVDGTIVSRILVTWEASPNGFVAQYETQYKPSADSVWSPSRMVGAQTLADTIWEVQDGVSYDVRVRALNSLNVASAWVSATNTVAGKSVPPSDVASINAQTIGNGGVVLRWTGVPDTDVKTYEVRYMAAPFNWNSATPVESGAVSQATRATTFSLPVGTWVVGVKALDTSGNYSINAATVRVVVTNSESTTIFSQQQAPDWLGTLTDCVHHQVSGRLIPESQDTDSLADDVMDEMVPRPVAMAYYELADEFDLGSDKTGVRTYAEASGLAAPGGSSSLLLTPQLDYRTNAGSYDGFEDLVVETITARYIKHRLVMDTAGGVGSVGSYNPLGDAPSRSEGETGVTVNTGGYAVVFGSEFFQVPNIQITSTGTAARVPVITAGPTTAGFTFELHDLSDVDQGGTANWTARGP